MIESFQSIISNPAFSQSLGWLFAGAMVIGGLLDDGWRKSVNWIIAAAVYAIGQEALRYFVIIETNHPGNANASIVIMLLTFTVYASGVMLGWLIVYLARSRVRKQQI